jgi:hypothetical protein
MIASRGFVVELAATVMATLADPLPVRAGDTVPLLLVTLTESQLTFAGMTTFQSPVPATDSV